MKILIACEFTGLVRDAFISQGHDAWSCDILDTEVDGPHIKEDVINIIHDGWDMMIAFPPCTHLCVSGARWFGEKLDKQEAALDFVRTLLCAPIEKIALENPVGIISTKIRPPNQVIQPWMFGHGETKGTCLWLENLPLLKPTQFSSGREQRIHNMPRSPDRGKERSRTYQGIADAMAAQWGSSNKFSKGSPIQMDLF